MPNYSKNIQIILCLLLVGVVLSILILCAVPPVSRDALTHHLAVPKLYLINGGIYEIPSNVFSYYPMNLDLLYWLCLYLGSDIAPKYIHFTFALLTAWLIFNYLKKELNLSYALLGALFFLTIPIIVKLSITVYVDLGLIFFSTAAILALLQWKKHQFHWPYLLFSAVSCGLALGTKYNGLILFFYLTMFVPFIFLRFGPQTKSRNLRSLIMTGVYIGIALLVFSPWMIKNYIWTENPVYPLYDKWFNSHQLKTSQNDLSFSQNSEEEIISKRQPQIKLNHFQIRRIVYGESALETLTIPLRVFFQGQDNQPKFFDGKLNPFLLLLPLMAFWGYRLESKNHQQDWMILLFFSVGYLLFVFVQTDMRIRWISPIVPPLTILSIFGLRRLVVRFSVQSHLVGKVIFAGVLFMATVLPCGMNLSYIYKQFQTVQPLDYISGKVTRDDYITRYRPEYPVIVHANQTLKKDAKILALFLGNRTYYSDRKMNSDMEFFFRALRQADSSKTLIELLLKKGFTHILMRFDLLQYRIETGLDNRDKIILRNFLQNYLKQIYGKNGYGLFSLQVTSK